MNILKAVNLRKIYGQGETEVKALDGVNLEVEKGEFVAIVGTSGSGKSTMLHMIGGLDNPTSGQVIVDGQNLSHMPDEELTIFRRRNIGFVFQQYNLVPMLNVWENIVLPVKLDGKKIEKGYVNEIIDTLGIRSKLENLPSALSGGQQQRVAIARALAAKPAILLADEPTGNLDSKTSQDVLGLLKVTSKRFHQTIVMITHNEEIAQMADRILQIEDGKYPGTKCRCTDYEVLKYRGKISGPIMDRIDIQKEVHPVNFFEITGETTGYSSELLRKKVEIARKIQQERYSDQAGVNCNAQMTTALIQKYCELDQESLKLLRKTSEEYGYSARVIHKLLRLARTSADIDKEEKIRLQDIRKVLDCRDLDKSNSKMLVVK